MLKFKHFLDTPESDDGQRLWVEPIGLTRDLQELCSVNHVLTHLGPPTKLWAWYERHPEAYDEFRAKYHDYLNSGPYRSALADLAREALKENFTLLHQNDDPLHNTAAALYEFLVELQAYTPREEPPRKA